jgi:hypothetical protein
LKLLYLTLLSTSLLSAVSANGEADVTISKMTLCNESICSKEQTDRQLYFYDVSVDLSKMEGNQIWGNNHDPKTLSSTQKTRVYMSKKRETLIEVVPSANPIHGYIAVQHHNTMPDSWVGADWNPVTGYAFDQWIEWAMFDWKWSDEYPYLYPSMETCTERLTHNFADTDVSGYSVEQLEADLILKNTLSREGFNDPFSQEFQFDANRFKIGHPYFGYQVFEKLTNHFECIPLTTPEALKNYFDNEKDFRGIGTYSNIDKFFESIDYINDTMDYPEINNSTVEYREVITYEIESLTNHN